MNSVEEKLKRSKRFYQIVIALAFIIFAFILWLLRTMILPTVVGALLAYACLPLMRKLKQKGFPDALALVLLLASFVVGISMVTELIRDIIPDANGKLVLRARVQYKMNQKYLQYIGVNKSFIGGVFAQEIDPLFKKINSVMSLDNSEHSQLEQYYLENREKDALLETYYSYHLSNREREKRKKIKEVIEQLKTDELRQGQKEPKPKTESGILSEISEIISTWLIAPFVFLFLLIDKGEIKKNLISLVPNRYFELALTIIDNIDEAIGKYLRGTMLECSLVGISFCVCLFMIGIDIQWALIIGFIAGLANAIPFLGPAIGLIVGVLYALIAENMQPVLPFINPDDIVIWILISVAIVQALDNSVFQPIVLGSAVSLHPLVVVFGVLGGSIIMGVAGMLFAIPTIVIIKVFFSTLIKELKSYHLIE
ncbi:AI-2E family transporter [bacterium]|nr:AI-2E family transporter [bacterium]